MKKLILIIVLIIVGVLVYKKSDEPDLTYQITETGEEILFLVKYNEAPGDEPLLASLHEGLCAETDALPYLPLNALIGGQSETRMQMSLPALRAQFPLALKVFEGFEPNLSRLACVDLI